MADLVVVRHGEVFLKQGVAQELVPPNTDRREVVLQNHTEAEYRIILGDGTIDPPTATHGGLLRPGQIVPIRSLSGFGSDIMQDPHYIGPIWALRVDPGEGQLDFIEVSIETGGG